MNFKSKIGVTKYNGLLPQMLRAKSKAMNLWGIKYLGSMANEPNLPAVPQIFMDDIFVGETEIKDISERTGCPESTYHCVEGTQFATIHLSHSIEMHERLHKCNIAVFDTSTPDVQAKISQKTQRTLAKMTDKIARDFDQIVITTIEKTAPRLSDTTTITVNNILDRITALGTAIVNDPEYAEATEDEVTIVVPNKYYNFVKEAYIKKLGTNFSAEMLKNGIKVTEYDGYRLEFWNEPQYIIATTSRAWAHALACFDSVDNIDVTPVKRNLDFDFEGVAGGGYPVQYLNAVDGTPIIKEIVVAYEETVSTGSTVSVVQAPNEQEGFRLYPRGSQDTLESNIKLAQATKKATEIANPSVSSAELESTEDLEPTEDLEALRKEAKELGISNVSKMKKETLEKKIEELKSFNETGNFDLD